MKAEYQRTVFTRRSQVDHARNKAPLLRTLVEYMLPITAQEQDWLIEHALALHLELATREQKLTNWDSTENYSEVKKKTD